MVWDSHLCMLFWYGHVQLADTVEHNLFSVEKDEWSQIEQKEIKLKILWKESDRNFVHSLCHKEIKAQVNSVNRECQSFRPKACVF